MGIAFSHGEAGWSYSGFNRFRARLACDALGVDLFSLRGFGGTTSWNTVKGPLKPLLTHSDCDGVLSPKECKSVAPALRAAVSAWPEEDYDRVMAQRLADGMVEAAEADEPLEFC